MTKQQLADKAGMSISYLSDLTNGKGNPSLEMMENLADALDTPLPTLLEQTDLDRDALDALKGAATKSSLPPGFERVSVVLPSVQAYQVKQWGEAARKRLQRLP